MLLLRAYDRPEEHERVVTGGRASAFKVSRGQFLTVTDVRGQQTGALFAFNPYDLREYLSPHNTRLMSEGLVPGVGTRFISNRRRTMLILVRDTVGRHDLLMPACTPAGDDPAATPPPHRCAESATAALREIGLAVPRLYDPVNLFMHVALHPDKRLTFEPSLSRAGDHVMFRAAMDSVCVLSACSAGAERKAAGRVTDLQVRVHNDL
jgi:uncharacterized protein YcgI (DUF1989 family)